MTSFPVLDVFSPAYASRPHDQLDAARECGPLGQSSRGVETLSYGACRETFRNDVLSVGLEDRFVATGIVSGPAFDAFVEGIINVEGVLHHRVRSAVGRYFTPRRIERMRTMARGLVEGWLDGAAAAGELEFVAAVGRRLPGSIFCAMLGADLEDADRIARLSDELLKIFLFDPAHGPAVAAAYEEVDDYVNALIARRRREPGDDVTSMLLDACDRGEVTVLEATRTIIAILAASTDTTNSQLSLNVVALAHHPEQWRLLREDCSLVPAAVLELARHSPAAWSTSRYARNGAAVGGHDLAPGSTVWANIVAANHDPAVFADPHRLNITASRGAPPLNWGSGRHFCIGRSLAVMQMEETLRVMLTRWASFSVEEPLLAIGQPYAVSLQRLDVRFVRRRT
jgi:cytochrome P450